MALPKLSNLDLPIENPKLSGPAIDAIEQRKEDNNNDPFTERQMEENFARVKVSVITSIKQLDS